jgi:hypothetical protein
MRSPGSPDRRPGDPRRSRHRYGPISHRRPPGLVGQVHPWRQAVRGQDQGQESTGHGNRYLARVLGEAAVAVGRTDTFLGERYRRIARRRGTNRAIVAVGRSILIIVWHLLADPTARSTTWTPTTMPATSARAARPATSCANSKPSATRSPWCLPPDHQPAIRSPAGVSCRLPSGSHFRSEYC